ncbi:MAG: DUF2812 domain-containing protein [Oscillospiraceae bacterium]|jgi:hypothetical protein|nr:DUF2812 domain-containing protein [Oscillospiraceae bacterium]
MKRWKFTFDKDEEQAWLNDYARQGWAMVSFFAGLVTFVPCEPGEFIYQIDLLPGTGLRADGFEGYREFMEETGVEVVERWARWVYLRKRSADGPFEVYSDAASLAAMYRRIRAMFLWVLALEFCCGITVWRNIWEEPVFFGAVAVLFTAIITGILRAVFQCSRKIRELEEGGTE